MIRGDVSDALASNWTDSFTLKMEAKSLSETL
jgi:hypothetical protein